MRLEVVDELVNVVGSCPNFALKYLASFLNSWKNSIVGRLKRFTYKNMWSAWIQCNMSPTMVANGCKLLNFCFIVSTAAHLSIKCKLTNRCASYATKRGQTWLPWSPLTPCSVQESACMVWRAFSVLSGIHLDRVSEMSLVVFFVVFFVIPMCTCINSVRKILGSQIVFTASMYVVPFSKFLSFHLGANWANLKAESTSRNVCKNPTEILTICF